MKRWGCALILMVALAAPAQAQTAQAQSEQAQSGQAPSVRRGLWGGFGFGVGTLSCLDDCKDRLEGFSGYGLIGGTPTENVRIGGAVTFYGRDENGQTLDFGTGLFIVQLFPGGGNFYLQAGAGFSTAELDFGLGKIEDEGAAFLGGIGYDVGLGSGRVSLVPFANWIVSSIELTPEMFQLGLGLVWN